MCYIQAKQKLRDVTGVVEYRKVLGLDRKIVAATKRLDSTSF